MTHYSIAACSVDIERQFRKNILHKSKAIHYANYERYHSSHDRMIICRKYPWTSYQFTTPVEREKSCVYRRAAGCGIAAAHRARLLSKRARREREKIHRYSWDEAEGKLRCETGKILRPVITHQQATPTRNGPVEIFRCLGQNSESASPY